MSTQDKTFVGRNMEDINDGISPQLLRSWSDVQHAIASQVIIPRESIFTAAQSQEDVRYAYYTHHLAGKECLLIGGVDVCFPATNNNIDDRCGKAATKSGGSSDGVVGSAVAVYVILKYTTATLLPKVVYRSHKYYQLTAPYIPSYLAFREIDPLMDLITQQINTQPQLTPDVIMVDGNGQWHERYAGLACFVGVKTGIPTIGVGKSFYNLTNNTTHDDDAGNGVGDSMKKNDIDMDIKRSVECWYDNAKKLHDGGCNYQPRFLIVDSKSIPSYATENEKTNAEQTQQQQSSTATLAASSTLSFEDMLKGLHQVGTGLAIPMRRSVDTSNKVLAYALIGHGGRVVHSSSKNSSSKKKKKDVSTSKGSKKPIYISCGSHISLLDAVSLVSYTSIARIPEPIREADLYGRQLLRERRSTSS
jgi:deoxyinosine 3'endonuclease (endonuclease V)